MNLLGVWILPSQLVQQPDEQHAVLSFALESGQSTADRIFRTHHVTFDVLAWGHDLLLLASCHSVQADLWIQIDVYLVLEDHHFAIRYTLDQLTKLPNLIKIGAKAVRHANYVTFPRAEVAVPYRPYRGILERMRRLASLSPRAAPI